MGTADKTAKTGSGIPRVTEVRTKLRAAIASGTFAVGDRLPTEPELTRDLGVSRSVLREAVAALKFEGLLESRQGAGVFVLRRQPEAAPLTVLTQAHATLADVIEELELRTAVEAEAAGIACERASPAQLVEIAARHRAFGEALAAGKGTEQADSELHRAIARATNNGRFEAFLEHLGARTIPRGKLREEVGEQIAPPSNTQLNEEHEAIVAAIENRDRDAAGAAMRAHLGGSIRRYRQLIQGA